MKGPSLGETTPRCLASLKTLLLRTGDASSAAEVSGLVLETRHLALTTRGVRTYILRDYLIDNDVIVFDSLLRTLREVVGKDVHDSVKKFNHKQRGN